jgi:hypothetical protein
MKTDLVEYLSDAIARVEGGGVTSPSGSWLAGIFGRAANLFEKELGSHVAGLLAACDLTYPRDFGEAVKGFPPYERLTLGQLLAVIREAGKRKPEITAQHVPGGCTLSEFLDDVQKVNAAWVDTKHGEEIQEHTLLLCIRTMLTLAKFLREMKTVEGTSNRQIQGTAPERRR